MCGCQGSSSAFRPPGERAGVAAGQPAQVGNAGPTQRRPVFWDQTQQPPAEQK